jgi:hypothetical protein
VSEGHEVEWKSVFVTGDHTAAYRVRNTLQAAGIEAEVCPARQGRALLVAGGWVEAPWHVIVSDTDAVRAGDLAERWQRRFGEGGATDNVPRPSRSASSSPGQDAATDEPAVPPPLDPPASWHK